MKIKKRLFIDLLILTVFLVSAYAFLPGYAQSQFYYPDQVDTGESPADELLRFEVINFPSHDGTMLNAWFVHAVNGSAEHAQGTVIFVHGNAGNITSHWALANWLPASGYNVFIFDYRGYGLSEGKPTPKGLFEDTQSAIDYVRNRADVDAEKLLLIGQSLGGNNAIAALGALEADKRQGICAVVIDSTFFSYSSIANDKFPGSGFLMNDDYSAQRYIQELSPIPLLFLHGTADRVIPYAHGQRLFELANSPKQFITIPQGEHIWALSGAYGKTYKDQVIAFFEEALQACPNLK